MTAGLLHVLSQAFKVMCPPEGVRQGQSIQVIVGYINAHPERMQARFELLAMDAFRKNGLAAGSDHGADATI
jgi:hypothetical protein